ncbi:DUF1402 family protein [Mesorhizobium sp. YM1C-6-2]|uniref:DUF1402 family protein n=1 Tax=Mesorhizobium sp. YM1C-6-2 TaxID=1827501 RepID=UPI000EF1B5ED|nr:DUF1402 family protein [Mesorhizobium sp. YM1C-6-2]RLP23748.1 DUF1402 family protein [Mesorhizobium sp. YM1C-6-2]
MSRQLFGQAFFGRAFTAFLAALFLASGVFTAAAVTLVPPGNRSVEQPGVPGGSSKRTKAGRTTFDAKYRKVYALLKNDRALHKKIVETASAYGIDPMHIVGAIVGEHTYNVDAYDRLQTYYVKAVAYLKADLSFTYEGEDVDDFVKRPPFSECTATGSYELWTCRERVWNSSFRGRTVGGTAFPDNRFAAVFFQPYYAGQTFGLGQLSPLTALQMSDLVNKVSGLPRLDAANPNQVYETIMDPDLTLNYVAAALKKSIDAYRDIAGFDISQNPGITATLYNIGNPDARAYALKRENDERASRGEAARFPEENYYGWLVNEKLPELQALF